MSSAYLPAGMDAAARGQRGPLEGLDQATELDSGWRVTAVPAALEATVSFQGRGCAGTGRRASSTETDLGKNAADTTRRAKTATCRYVVGNRLSQFVTLTWAKQPRDKRFAHGQMTRFLGKVRRDGFFEGAAIPWLYVLEFGTECGGLHAHVFLPRSFARSVERCWPHGGVDICLLGSVDERREKAIYVGKRFDSERYAKGERRYRSAERFMPEVVRSHPFDREVDALACARQMMGRDAIENVRTRGFGGIPVHHLRWNDDTESDGSTTKRNVPSTKRNPMARAPAEWLP